MPRGKPQALSTRGRGRCLVLGCLRSERAFGGRIGEENANRWFSEPIVIAIVVTVVDDLYGIPESQVKRNNRSTYVQKKALRYVTRHKSMRYYRGLEV